MLPLLLSPVFNNSKSHNPPETRRKLTRQYKVIRSVRFTRLASAAADRAVDAMAIDAQAWPLDGGNRSARQVICICNIQAFETGPLCLVKRLYFCNGAFKECKRQHTRLQEIVEARKTGDDQKH